MRATWRNNRVEHKLAKPLNCVEDEDVNNLLFAIRGLPADYSLSVFSIGGNTGTATIGDTTIIFTLPTQPGTDTWTVHVNDAQGGGVDEVFMKLTTT